MEVRNMNGLKFIRTRCNYSQAALAEQLNVSRQAINMWKCSKKNLSDSRKKELKEFFGLDNDNLFGEIDDETVKKISNLPLYRIVDETSEHFRFSPINESFSTHSIHFSNNEENPISLDDKCTLKRHELKKTIEEIQEYSEKLGLKNSYDRIHRINITQRILGGIFDALKIVDSKKANKKMIYIYTLFSIIDAINIAFGNISLDDITKSNVNSTMNTELYDYSEFTKYLSEKISNHLNTYFERVDLHSKKR